MPRVGSVVWLLLAVPVSLFGACGGKVRGSGATAIVDAGVDASSGSPGDSGANSETGSSGGDSGSGDSGSSSGGGDDAGVGEGGDAGLEPPSCVAGGPGMTNCGTSANESCCTSPEVTGGTYSREYTPTDPSSYAFPATVSTLRLDKYDVTVGRFLQFAQAWSNGWVPAAGSGKHTHLNGGLGLVYGDAAGMYEPGWVASDDSNLAPTPANLACGTDVPGADANLPITCVNWWEAYAFCIWDGGFLPSMAEWEYAGAGGNQQRQYPWGSANPSTQYAIYDCGYSTIYSVDAGACPSTNNIAPVGYAWLGAGLWGQLDLAGNVYAWNLDWGLAYQTPCVDCAYLVTPGDYPGAREARGNRGSDAPELLSPTNRGGDAPQNRDWWMGIRCARTP